MFEDKYSPEVPVGSLITEAVVMKKLYGNSYIVKGKLKDDSKQEVEVFLHSSQLQNQEIIKQKKREQKEQAKKERPKKPVEEGEEEKEEPIELDEGDRLTKEI